MNTNRMHDEASQTAHDPTHAPSNHDQRRHGERSTRAPRRASWAGLIAVAALWLLVGQSASVAAEPTYDPMTQRYEVAVVEAVTVHDPGRSKTITVLVRHPIGLTEPAPVVVFSHGALANERVFEPLSRHLAARGFVAIHPRHDDARRVDGGLGGVARQGRRAGDDEDGMRRARAEADEKDGRRRALRGLFGSADERALTRVNRVLDVNAVIDGLDQIEAQVEALAQRLDHDHVVVAGHSFGAYVAQIAGGVTTDDGEQPNRHLGHPAVRAILAISPQGVSEEYGLNKASWSSLAVPMMSITGTRDRGVGGRGLDWKLEPFHKSPPGQQYAVIIEGANHFSFGGGPIGGRSWSPSNLGSRAGDGTAFDRSRLRDRGPNAERDRLTRAFGDGDAGRDRRVAADRAAATPRDASGLVQLVATAFLEAHVLGDTSARRYLDDGGLGAALGDDAEFLMR